MNMLKILFAVAVALLVPLVCSAEPCKVIRVIDGDTVEIVSESFKGEINLEGVDAPEEGQPYHQEARDHLESLVSDQPVSVSDISTSEMTANFHLANGRSVNVCMIYDGYAWSVDRDNNHYLMRVERGSKERGRNLWSASNVVEPWRFREANGIMDDRQKDLQKISVFKNLGQSGSQRYKLEKCANLEGVEREICIEQLKFEVYQRIASEGNDCSELTGKARQDCMYRNMRVANKVYKEYTGEDLK